MPDLQTLIAMYRDTSAGEMSYRYSDNPAWSLTRDRLQSRFSDSKELAVLDVGCHTGAFLNGLPNSWHKYGIESARDPAAIAREKHGVTLIGERIEAISPEWTHRFDVVTMFDVIEHLPDPNAGIAHAVKLLKPGGTLILSSADLDAWTWRWLGSGHWYLQTPQHLSVISPRFLRHVASRQALNLIDVEAIPHRYAPVGDRLLDAVKAIYWGSRLRQGPYRVLHRLLQSIPGWRRLRHLQSVPWAMTLKDHCLVTFEC